MIIFYFIMFFIAVKVFSKNDGYIKELEKRLEESIDREENLAELLIKAEEEIACLEYNLKNARDIINLNIRD